MSSSSSTSSTSRSVELGEMIVEEPLALGPGGGGEMGGGGGGPMSLEEALTPAPGGEVGGGAPAGGEGPTPPAPEVA